MKKAWTSFWWWWVTRSDLLTWRRWRRSWSVQDSLKELLDDAVHYNPYDISNWFYTMLSNFDSLPSEEPDKDYPSSNYDLKGISGKAIYEGVVSTAPNSLVVLSSFWCSFKILIFCKPDKIWKPDG